MVHRRETLFVTGHPQTTGFRHMTCGGGLDSELLCLRPSEKVSGSGWGGIPQRSQRAQRGIGRGEKGLASEPFSTTALVN
jgi:hypothetical protein